MMKFLETLPLDAQNEIRHAFNEAVEKRVQAEVSDANSFNEKLKESYNRNLAKMHSRLKLESKIALAKKEREYKKSLARVENIALKTGEKVENKLRTMYESRASKTENVVQENLEKLYEAKFQKYSAALTAQVLKENKVEALQAEDGKKVLKLLSLFEEMVKVFGITLQDLMENAESEKEEKVEEELKESRALKQSYRTIFKENIVLKSAIRHNISDVDGFKKIMAGIKFTNAKDYNENCDIMAEKFGSDVGFFKESKDEGRSVDSTIKPEYLSLKQIF